MAVLTTPQLRNEYAPPCHTSRVTIALNGAGKITVAAITQEAFLALNKCLVKWGYKTRKADTGAYNCRKITGGTGYSLHAYSIAADINWQDNPYGPRLVTDMPRGMIDDILAIRTKSGARVFGWGGYYKKNKDAMHFEVVCSKADLRSGINSATTPGGAAQPQEDDLANVTETEKARMLAAADAVERIEEFLREMPINGFFSYGGSDLNVLWTEKLKGDSATSQSITQRVWTGQEWERARVIVQGGIVPGSVVLGHRMNRGTRLNAFAQRTDGKAIYLKFVPEEDPTSWTVQVLP